MTRRGCKLGPDPARPRRAGSGPRATGGEESVPGRGADPPRPHEPLQRPPSPRSGPGTRRSPQSSGSSSDGSGPNILPGLVSSGEKTPGGIDGAGRRLRGAEAVDVRPFCRHPQPAAPGPRPGAAAAKGGCPCGGRRGTRGPGAAGGPPTSAPGAGYARGCRPRWRGCGLCSIVGIFVSPVPAGPRRRCGNPPGCSGEARPRNAAPHSLHGPGVKLRRTAPVQSSGGRVWCTVPVNGFVSNLRCPASVQGSGARSWCPAPKHSRGIKLRCPVRITAPVPGPVPGSVPSPSARRPRCPASLGEGSGRSGAAAPPGSASVLCDRGIEFTSGGLGGLGSCRDPARPCRGERSSASTEGTSRWRLARTQPRYFKAG